MLQVKGVSKRYGSIHALSDVSLSAAEGEVVALVGENGAGKSTLVRCIARAIAADSGSISIAENELGRTPRDAITSGLSVVWQDLALCENLDVTANLFLGRELGSRGALRTAAMRSQAASVFRDLHVEVPELSRPIERLSGGQRQLVAIARATLDQPRVLILDEPTAALGIAETRTILNVVRTLQSRGVTILLVSHQLDEVFAVADRIAIMRHGRIVSDLHRAETHPDDVVALITGANVDSTAGQQLRRLHSLAEQLADADESSALPMTVSSLSAALSTDRLAILLLDDDDGHPVLRRSAVLNLSDALASELTEIDLEQNSFVAKAAREGSLSIVAQLRDIAADAVARSALSDGLSGAWAAPILGQRGTLAVIVGFSDTVAQLQPDQLQLLELFCSMAGVALERGRLVETLGERNRSLEGLQGVLETLAGPDLPQSGMASALDALCDGADADAAMLLLADSSGNWKVRARSTPHIDPIVERQMQAAMNKVEQADEFERSVRVAEIAWSRGHAGLVCLWPSEAPADSRQLIDGAANSFRLAMEREITVEAEQEAAAYQRSRDLERQLTRRIGHELRTPLTAIQGFASTMRQSDVEWPEAEKQRFLEVIETEAGRMDRLVAQMFDESALESGLLRLDLDDCDLVTIAKRAVSVAAPMANVTFTLPDRLEVWGDSDRLEQVLVNLVGNAIKHNEPGTPVEVRISQPHVDADSAIVEVADGGKGMPDEARRYLIGEVDQRDRNLGIGLRLVRGLVEAHHGAVAVDVDNGTVVQVTLPTGGSEQVEQVEVT